jgi:hypothetical protein
MKTLTIFLSPETFYLAHFFLLLVRRISDTWLCHTLKFMHDLNVLRVWMNFETYIGSARNVLVGWGFGAAKPVFELPFFFVGGRPCPDR